MKQNYIWILWSLVALLADVATVYCQCSLPGPITIADQSTGSGYFRPDRLVIDDLGNAGQGICRINIRFRHSSIGDVSLTLQSPDGSVYELLAPSGTRPTHGTTWDISFVRCSENADPDIGNFIKPRWDSDQDWGQNETYTGTYYPVTCLEDINSGSANGLWIVSVSDVNRQGAGEIEAFDIVFCDTQGMQCSDCVRNGGRIDSDTVEVCGGDPMLSNIRVFPTFEGIEPDPTQYTYVYIITSEGRIIQISEDPDLTAESRGDYALVGLMVDNRDLADILLFEGKHINILNNALEDDKLQYCATRSSGYKLYRILSDPGSHQVVTAFVCQESPIQFGSKTITEAGIFFEVFTSSTGCDSTVELRVTEFTDVTTTTPIVDPGVLSCSNKPLSLEWSTAILTDPIKYQWHTDQGSILSEPTKSQIDIDLPGTYHLSISQGGCTDTVSIDVPSNGTLPTLDIRNIVMDCSANIGLLRPMSNATAFDWTGPFGFKSSNQNLDVTEPGAYTLVATGSNCAVRKTIQVSADFDAPQDVTVVGGTIRCAMDTVSLSASSSTAGVTYSWSGPNGFTSTMQNPLVSDAGFYTARVSSPTGGCAVQQQTEVVSIYSEPVINVTGATLDCQSQSKQIVTTVSEDLVTFQWSGPNGFNSTQKSPTINTVGDYEVTITDSRQCTYTQSATVTIDTIRPTISTNDIQVGCMETQFMLTGSVSSLHPPTYTWTGPNNYRSDVLNAMATQAGTYEIIVHDPVNQCQARSTLVVNPDPGQPLIQTENGQINCAQSQDTLVVDILSCLGGCDVNWSGPNGFTGTDSSVIVTEGGVYEVEVRNRSSGCLSIGQFRVQENTTAVGRNVQISPIGCTNPGRVRLVNNNNFQKIEWRDSITGDSFTSAAATSSLPTTFQLASIDQFGCPDTALYRIPRKDVSPELTLLMDTIDCAIDAVKIGTDIGNYTLSQIAIYDWTLPDGSHTDAAIPLVDEPGLLRLDVTMTNGCLGSTSGQVVTDFSPPSLDAIGGGYQCSENGRILNFIMDRDPILVSWSGPNAFRSNLRSPLAEIPGVYKVEVLGANGCSAEDTTSIYITDPLPNLELNGDTITCNEPAALLNFTTNAAAGYRFRWIDPGGRIDTVRPVIQTTLVGPYQLEIIDTQSCRVVEQVRVDIDTISILPGVSSEVVSCVFPSSILDLDTILSQLIYRWDHDSSFFSDVPEPLATSPGLYTLTTINTNGCTRVKLHEVLADTVPPDFTLTDDTLNCSKSRITILPIGQNGQWNYNWSGPPGFQFGGPTPLVDEPGIYVLKATSKNGCSTEKKVTIYADFAIPQIDVEDAFIPCNGDSVTLSFDVNTILAESNWFGPDGFYVLDTIARTLRDGTYYLLAKAPNGCQTFDSIFVSPDPLLEDPQIKVSHINCLETMGSVTVRNVMNDFSYLWHDESGSTSPDTSFQVMSAQRFLLEAEHLPSGCILYDTALVQVDTLAPSVSIIERDSIICTHREISIGSEVDTVVSYEWSTVDGHIVGADTLASIRADLPGLYRLQVMGLINGCQSEARFQAIERPNNLNGFSAFLNPANCEGGDDGLIFIDSIYGGTGPFEFSLGGQHYTPRNVFQFLAPTDYVIYVRDVNGCEYDTAVVIGRVPAFDLGFDQDEYVLNLGDSLDLMIETNLGGSGIASAIWQVPDSFPCNLCDGVRVSPLENTWMTVEVLSVDGCLKRDSVLVRVNDPGGIFVPNGFTPNADGVNDVVTVYTGNNIDHVKGFEIYDRWGNNVFSAFDFAPGDAEGEWNGTYRGRELNPGVYIYQVRAIDIRGTDKIKTGDLTLIR